MGDRRKRRLAAAGLLALVLVAGAGGLVLWRHEAGSRGPAPAAWTQRPPLHATLTPETRLVERVHYRHCGMVLETERPLGPAEAGRTLADLLRRRASWRLVEYSGGRLVLGREVGGPCPPQDLLRFRTVGIHEGYVAIYYGRGTGGPLRQLTEIEASRLLPGDRRRLATGLVVPTDHAAWQLIESLLP
ncbi:MAG TPA: hypothetical protein VIK92_00810 [Thermaerobacter sp.]